MLGRMLNSDKKQVSPFGSTNTSYQENLYNRGFLRLSDAYLGYFEIRAQTKGPEETLDEVLKYMTDMKHNEVGTIEQMKNDVKKLLTPKFFEAMLTSPGLQEKINKLEKDEIKNSPTYQEKLHHIRSVDAEQLKRKYNALNSILLKYTGTNMLEMHKKYIDISFFNLDDKQAREKLLELSKKPNFSLDNLFIDYSNFLETKIGEYFKDSPVTKTHAAKIIQGLWEQIPIDDQVKIINESHKSSSRWVFARLNGFAHFDKKVQNAIIDVFVTTLNDHTTQA